MEDKINIDVSKLDPSKFSKFGWVLLVLFLLFNSIYTVDANANAVILRFGKYSSTEFPGLHFKIPFIDSVHKVKVAYQYKEEFRLRTLQKVDMSHLPLRPQ